MDAQSLEALRAQDMGRRIGPVKISRLLISLVNCKKFG
jgi:hypothetical protein